MNLHGRRLAHHCDPIGLLSQGIRSEDLLPFCEGFCDGFPVHQASGRVSTHQLHHEQFPAELQGELVPSRHIIYVGLHKDQLQFSNP